MNNTHKPQYFLSCTSCIAIILLSFLSGCATTLTPKVDSSAKSTSTQQKPASHTPIKSIKTLEINLKKDEMEGLALFAPRHYTMANQALSEALALINKKASNELISQKVSTAETLLHSGNKVKTKVKALLEKQFLIKEKLDLLRTNKTYQSEYISMTSQLQSIIHDIENGNVQQTHNTRKALLVDMQTLELRSVQYHALHEPSEIIQRIKHQNGEKLAPRTYQDALAVYQRSERFIHENPNNKEGAEKVGAEALFAARRALYITNQVSALIQKIDFSLEQVILDEEYRLYRVGRELNSPDLRDNPLEIQSEKLALFAKNKNNKNKNKNNLIVSLQASLAKKNIDSSQLDALKITEINEKIAKGKLHVEKVLLKKEIVGLKKALFHSQTKLSATQKSFSTLQNQYTQLNKTSNSRYRPSFKLPNYEPPRKIQESPGINQFNRIFVDAGE